MAFNCAIIGCGNIAGGYDAQVPTQWSATHAGAYHLCPHTKLIAAADPDPSAIQSFQEKWRIERGYADYEEMLEKESVDILSLCLPTQFHFNAFSSAIDHDIKAIFCEKPLSNDLGEARRMVELASERTVAINYFRRWNPTLSEVAAELKNGLWGKAVSVTVRYTKGLMGNGSHMVDLLRWFFGEPEDIRFLKIASEDIYDPGVDFSLTFIDGQVAYFVNIPGVDYVFIDVDIAMEKGRIVIGQRGQKISKYAVVSDPYYQVFNILDDGQTEQTQWRNCLTRAVCEIVDCLKQSTRNVSCTLKDGYRALEICHQVLSLRKQTTD